MRRLARTYLCLFGLLVLLSSTSGCTALIGVRDYLSYDDLCNDAVLGYRNQVWARQSWHENRPAHCDEPYCLDFGRGYRAGYREVASGGSGCPPAVPPRCYWTWHYQTPEGQAKVAAWFAGYPQGAAAAEQDMAGRWQHIQVAKHVETQYSEAFQNGTIFLPRELHGGVVPSGMVEPPISNGQPPDALPVPAPQPGASGATPEQMPLPRPAPGSSGERPPNSSSSFRRLPAGQGSEAPEAIRAASFSCPTCPPTVPGFRPQGSLPDNRTGPWPPAN